MPKRTHVPVARGSAVLSLWACLLMAGVLSSAGEDPPQHAPSGFGSIEGRVRFLGTVPQTGVPDNAGRRRPILPYFDVTGEHGRFSIEAVPAGTYSIVVYQPDGRLRAEGQIAVSAGNPARLNVEFSRTHLGGARILKIETQRVGLTRDPPSPVKGLSLSGQGDLRNKSRLVWR